MKKINVNPDWLEENNIAIHGDEMLILLNKYVKAGVNRTDFMNFAREISSLTDTELALIWQAFDIVYDYKIVKDR